MSQKDTSKSSTVPGAASLHVLPPLPYAEHAFDPVITAKTMSFHYGKHHKGYVDNRLVSASEQNIALEGRNIVPGARFSLFGKHLKFLAGVMQCCGAKG